MNSESNPVLCSLELDPVAYGSVAVDFSHGVWAFSVFRRVYSVDQGSTRYALLLPR